MAWLIKYIEKRNNRDTLWPNRGETLLEPMTLALLFSPCSLCATESLKRVPNIIIVNEKVRVLFNLPPTVSILGLMFTALLPEAALGVIPDEG